MVTVIEAQAKDYEVQVAKLLPHIEDLKRFYNLIEQTSRTEKINPEDTAWAINFKKELEYILQICFQNPSLLLLFRVLPLLIEIKERGSNEQRRREVKEREDPRKRY